MEKESNSSDLAMTGDAPGSGRARRRARGANAALTVRAIVDGDGHAGRDILRGVIEYIEQRTGWHLAIDVNPLRFVNPRMRRSSRGCWPTAVQSSGVSPITRHRASRW